MLLLRGKQIRLTDLLVEGEVDDISGVVKNLGAGDSQGGEGVEWQDWVVCRARLDEATERQSVSPGRQGSLKMAYGAASEKTWLKSSGAANARGKPSRMLMALVVHVLCSVSTLGERVGVSAHSQSRMDRYAHARMLAA